MFNVGGGEVLVILLLAIIVLGPDKLPNAAKQAGKYLSEFRRISNGFQQELKDAMDLNPLNTKPQSGTMTDAGPTLPPLPITPDAAVSGATGSNGDRSEVAPASASPAVPAPTAEPSPPTAPAPIRAADISVDGPPTSFS